MGLLAEWFVQIRTKGADQANQEIDKTGDKLKKAEKNAEGFQRAATVAFASATAGVLGFVRAGLQGTVEGEHLTMSFQQLSREIAALFLPAIQKVTEWAQRATDWFRTLSRSQQESIGRWTALGLVGLGFVAMAPRIVASVAAINTALKAMGTTGALAAGGLAAAIALAPQIDAAGRAAAGVSEQEEEERGNGIIDRLIKRQEEGSESWGTKIGGVVMGYWIEKRKKELAGAADVARNSLTNSAGGFENPTSTYRRIAQSAIKAQEVSPEVRAMQEVKASVDQVAAKIDRLQPTVR